jgi:hypothetical protein
MALSYLQKLGVYSFAFRNLERLADKWCNPSNYRDIKFKDRVLCFVGGSSLSKKL